MKAQTNSPQKAQTSSRELVLLSLPQVSKAQIELAQERSHELRLALEAMMLNAIATLQEENEGGLEASMAELQRSKEKLLNSQTRASDNEQTQIMTAESIELAENAIELLGPAIEINKLINKFNNHDVRAYAIELLMKTTQHTDAVDTLLSKSIVDWKLGRLPKIDRDILRLAVTEIVYLDLPEKIAINEAVELAKRYSDEQGRRFINGALRRVTENLNSQKKKLKLQKK
jgi:transcription antitermination protein NusB